MEPIIRAEFEERMERMDAAIRLEFAHLRSEVKDANDHQDEEWNKGFRALREDNARAFDLLRSDLRSFVTTDVFVARINPVQAVAYGLVALLMTLMTGMLAMGILARATK